MTRGQSTFLARLAIAAIAVFSSAQIFAQDIANCSKTDEQIKFLQQKQKEVIRIEALKVLLGDLKNLKANMFDNKDAYPKSLLATCYNKKIQAIQGMIEIADEQLMGNADFLMLFGEYSMVRGNYKAAYEYFQQVAVRYPATYIPHWKTLEAWTYWRKYAQDNMDRKEINVTTLSLLKNLIDTQDVPKDMLSYAETLNNTLTKVVTKI